MVKSIKSKSGGGFFVSIIKGSLISLSVSLILICIFAFMLRFLDISESLIKPINQVIKIISIFVGGFYGLKGTKEMGLITGFFIGIMYSLLAFVIFSILNGGFAFNMSIINDAIFSGVSGGLVGIICVNIIKK